MAKYIKRPVVIEAVQWTGNNINEVRAHSDGSPIHYMGDGQLGITTLEGVMTASPLDWIIRGVKGEIYPCKPDIFAILYEPVEAAP